MIKKWNNRSKTGIGILLFAGLLSGCSDDINRKEIDEVDIVQIVAIDYQQEQFQLGVLYTENGSNDESTAVIIKAEGKSIFEAYENLKKKNKRSITLAHTNYFMVGDEAAKYGLKDCLDYFSRDETIKMDSGVIIVKEHPAFWLLEYAKEKELKIFENLNAINQKQIETLTESDNTIAHFLNKIEEKGSTMLVPYYVVEEDSVYSEGYGFCEDAKLVEYLDEDTSLGIDFIRNRVRTCPIYLKGSVGLSVADTKTTLNTKIQNGKLLITVQMNFETTIREVLDSQNQSEADMLQNLTNQQNEYMKRIMQKAIDYAQTKGKDVLGIKELIRSQHPSEWETVDSNWKQYLKTIRFEFQIHSKVVKSFLMDNER